jgi:hypothetical protein
MQHRLSRTAFHSSNFFKTTPFLGTFQSIFFAQRRLRKIIFRIPRRIQKVEVFGLKSVISRVAPAPHGGMPMPHPPPVIGFHHRIDDFRNCTSPALPARYRG